MGGAVAREQAALPVPDHGARRQPVQRLAPCDQELGRGHDRLHVVPAERRRQLRLGAVGREPVDGLPLALEQGRNLPRRLRHADLRIRGCVRGGAERGQGMRVGVKGARGGGALMGWTGA